MHDFFLLETRAVNPELDETRTEYAICPGVTEIFGLGDRHGAGRG